MEEQRQFWLISLLQTVFIAAVAYVVALFLELVLLRIAQLPHGPLWAPEFEAPFLFIITMIIAGLLSIPYFMKEWDPGLRTFSMFSSVMLVAMVVFTKTGAYNPDGPLQYLTVKVLIPLRHVLNF
jgi:predicted neutral ceramidase superfamily lipid hydrolase